jgi:hypothetical protein
MFYDGGAIIIWKDQAIPVLFLTKRAGSSQIELYRFPHLGIPVPR